ncbi:MAG: methyltransferase domain-containing protein [Desulfobacterales bacterium]|nr:methyltransferase domain-containing protein [Desulfobacterales bacterium]
MGKKEQYSSRGILRYEWMFGHGFLSYGGADITRKLASQVDWEPGFHVLDVGSGLGGAAFLLAEEHRARVLGVDLTPEIVEIAQTRKAENPGIPVSFQQGDIHAFDWEANTFDVIWSRETLLHVPRKDELFGKFYRWTRPGGCLIITDYARRNGKGSPAFEDYVRESGYPLVDLETYGRVISEAGFEPLHTQDRSDLLIAQLEKQIDYLKTHRNRFLEQFSENELAECRQRWQLKLDACRSGDMKWGWFLGRKEAGPSS